AGGGLAGARAAGGVCVAGGAEGVESPVAPRPGGGRSDRLSEVVEVPQGASATAARRRRRCQRRSGARRGHHGARGPLARAARLAQGTSTRPAGLFSHEPVIHQEHPVTKLEKTVLGVAAALALASGPEPRAQVPDRAPEKDAARIKQPTEQVSAPKQSPAAATPAPDLSGRKRVGKASFYAKRFAGKPMADGAPMDPKGDNAASRTLPLGTTAKVTNVETGKTAVVTIEDRGPYVDGRLVDLSPGTASKIGLTPRKGVTKVVVAPIAVPLPNGKVKEGAAAHEPAAKPDT